MRIVLVDPSRTALKFVSRILESQNHEVRAFVDPCGALDYLKSDPEVAALMTSFELGSMSGLKLCRDARRLAKRRPLYIILMSSNHDGHKLVEALDNGADDFVGKPPAIEELHARLRAAARFVGMQRELFRLASTDPLSGILNRRAFFELATEALEHLSPAKTLSAIMLDIDHFKRVNDEHGHDIGDEAIRQVARLAAAHGRLVGRLGGEEFAIILEGFCLADAIMVAEELRTDVSALRLPSGAGSISLTCSQGVSEWETNDTIDRLLHRADIALYAAKAGGRNRVVAYDAASLPAGPQAAAVTRSARRDASGADAVDDEATPAKELVSTH